ncbi:MAG: hypothetical protein ACRD3J_19010, partial [Thermoanaerobaculia bacterium]
LPTIGGPDVLSGEVHSFARIFTGCFYDTIRNILASQPSKSPADLANAARISGKLLIDGASSAILRPRLFEEVGIAMLVADQANNGGRNSTSVREAFERHGITLTVTPRIHQALALAATQPRQASIEEVSLSGLHPSLDDVVAEAVTLPTAESREDYAVMNGGSSPSTGEEVRFFVQTLLAHGSIGFGQDAAKDATHTVQSVNNRRVLERVRFHGAIH